MISRHTDELGRPPLFWRSFDGYTPLRYAAWKGHGTAVIVLLEAGSDALAEDNKPGHSALALARELTTRPNPHPNVLHLVDVLQRSVHSRELFNKLIKWARGKYSKLTSVLAKTFVCHSPKGFSNLKKSILADDLTMESLLVPIAHPDSVESVIKRKKALAITQGAGATPRVVDLGDTASAEGAIKRGVAAAANAGANAYALEKAALPSDLDVLTTVTLRDVGARLMKCDIDKQYELQGVIEEIFAAGRRNPSKCGLYADLCDHLCVFENIFLRRIVHVSEKGEGGGWWWRFTMGRQGGEKVRGPFPSRDKAFEAGASELPMKRLFFLGMQNELKVPPSRLGTEAKRKRWLSTIVLVGHLYTRNLFDTERHPARGREIIHTVVKQLFNSGASARSDVFDASRTPKEAHIECLVNLLLTPKLGRMIDRRAIHCVESGEVNNWFRCLADFSTRPSSVISDRIRGMCAGVCDVRRMGWPLVASIAGPKLIGAGEVALVEAVGRDSAPGVASASARSAAGSGADEGEQERTDALRDEMLKVSSSRRRSRSRRRRCISVYVE